MHCAVNRGVRANAGCNTVVICRGRAVLVVLEPTVPHVLDWPALRPLTISAGVDPHRRPRTLSSYRTIYGCTPIICQLQHVLVYTTSAIRVPRIH